MHTLTYIIYIHKYLIRHSCSGETRVTCHIFLGQEQHTNNIKLFQKMRPLLFNYQGGRWSPSPMGFLCLIWNIKWLKCLLKQLRLVHLYIFLNNHPLELIYFLEQWLPLARQKGFSTFDATNHYEIQIDLDVLKTKKIINKDFLSAI